MVALGEKLGSGKCTQVHLKLQKNPILLMTSLFYH